MIRSVSVYVLKINLSKIFVRNNTIEGKVILNTSSIKAEPIVTKFGSSGSKKVVLK